MTERIIVARLGRHPVYFHPLQPFSDCYLRGPLTPFEVFEDENWFKTSGVRRWRIGQRSKCGYRSQSDNTYDNIESAEQARANAPKEAYLALVQVYRNDKGTAMVTIRRRDYGHLFFDLRRTFFESAELTVDEKELLAQGVEVYRSPAINATRELPLEHLIDEVRRLAGSLEHFPTIVDFRWHSRFDYKTLMKRLKVTRWPEVKSKVDGL